MFNPNSGKPLARLHKEQNIIHQAPTFADVLDLLSKGISLEAISRFNTPKLLFKRKANFLPGCSDPMANPEFEIKLCGPNDIWYSATNWSLSVFEESETRGWTKSDVIESVCRSTHVGRISVFGLKNGTKGLGANTVRLADLHVEGHDLTFLKGNGSGNPRLVFPVSGNILPCPGNKKYCCHPSEQFPKGLWVESRGEQIVAAILAGLQVQFEYERKLKFLTLKKCVLPDFTVDHNGKTYYWEHLGMLGKPLYLNNWLQKQDSYKANGFGKQLIESTILRAGNRYVD